jgi:hypothetical protein
MEFRASPTSPTPAIVRILAGAMACMLAIGAAWAKPSDVTDPEAPRSLPADGPVDVRWTDPAQFTEILRSGNRREARRGDWVHDLAEYLRKRASDRLPDGQRLDVTITDITRAGNYEPGRGIGTDSIRFMRDVYPPRITLDFKLVGANGSVIAQGTRELSDIAYLQRGSPLNDSDQLRYEKRLIDDWLRKEFREPAA